MAVTDAYATAAEYRARVDKASAADDSTILAQLTALSRFIDWKCGRHFTQDAAVTTRLYDGHGQAYLRLEDDIATLTGLVVKVDLDADYDFGEADETLTVNEHFWIDSQRAAFGSEPMPWGRLQLVPTNGRLNVWPDQRNAVEVTAVFGWPAVPAAIKEATIALTRQLRDIQQSGMTLTLENIDAQVRVSPQASRIVDDLLRAYKRRNRSGVFV